MLVERTVAEVKPAVQGNKEQLDLVRSMFHGSGIPNKDVKLQERLLVGRDICCLPQSLSTHGYTYPALSLEAPSNGVANIDMPVPQLSSALLLAATAAEQTQCPMAQVVGQLVKQINTKKKELTEFQEKYKIRIKVQHPPVGITYLLQACSGTCVRPSQHQGVCSAC